MSVFALATMGGFISFFSTTLGALLSLISRQSATSSRWNLSIDFALGLMVSAAAFSLIGPAALEAKASGISIFSVLAFAIAGAGFVYFMKTQVEKFSGAKNLGTSHLILASVLMLHNFPEGLASGSALAGLDLKAAIPILGGISIQNIPEGALMVICLRTLGWNSRHALLGGIASGLVELSGGVLAGVLLQVVQNALPFLLSFAGGSMIASVVIEFLENKETASSRIWSRQFAMGLICLPLIQFITF